MCRVSLHAQVDAMEASEYNAELGQELISAPGTRLAKPWHAGFLGLMLHFMKHNS